MANVLLIASGSIGVVNLVSYIIELKKHGLNCKCIMTPSAAGFLPPKTVASFVDTYTDDHSIGSTFTRVPHIALAKWASLILVLPATANMISKMAYGLADNLATSTILASEAQVVVFPNMEKEMANKPVIQRNINLLKEFGVHVYDKVGRSYAVSAQRYEESLVLPDFDELADVLKTYLGTEIKS